MFPTSHPPWLERLFQASENLESTISFLPQSIPWARAFFFFFLPSISFPCKVYIQKTAWVHLTPNFFFNISYFESIFVKVTWLQSAAGPEGGGWMKWIPAGLQKKSTLRGRGGGSMGERWLVRNAERKRERNQNNNNKIIIAAIILVSWMLHLCRRI